MRSYRDLPLAVYHFQVKERDEPRPRAGVLRTREFVMKDAYTFDRDAAGLDVSYDRQVGAYDRIMERTGLRFYRVEGEVGMMGGLGAHEYMAPCAAGEDRVALAEGYAANLEVALRHPEIREVDATLLPTGPFDPPIEAPMDAPVRTPMDPSLKMPMDPPLDMPMDLPIGTPMDAPLNKRYALGDRELTIEPAIEIANIFKLGTRYSEPLGARYLDEHGAEHPIWMGCYGIGPARIVAAAVEQYADEHGISWPRALAPFAVHLVALGKPGTPERDAADGVYETLRAGGVEVLYDDRDLGTGEKFADAELLGCPLRLTDRAPLAGVGRDRGADPSRPPERSRACPWAARPRRCCGRWMSCGRASPRDGRRWVCAWRTDRW